MTDWFSLCARIVGGHQGSSQVPLKTSPQRAVHSWQTRWVPCCLQNAANTSMAFAGCLILEEWMETFLFLSGVDLNSQTQPLRCMWPFWLHAAAAAAKSLQSCPTLCDPIDGSPLGSSVPGILQARTLEWVAISFSIHVILKMFLKIMDFLIKSFIEV